MTAPVVLRTVPAAIPLLPQNLRAAVNLQNRQRQRRSLRRARSASVSKQLKYELRLSNPERSSETPSAGQRPQPRVADAHQHLIANGLQKIRLIGPPLMLFRMSQSASRRHLRFFVRDHHAQRRRQPQVAQNRSFHCCTTSAPSSSGSAFSMCASSSTTCAPSAASLQARKIPRPFPAAGPECHHCQRARSAQYPPTSLTAVLSIAPRLSAGEYLLIASEIFDRSRSVSAE